MADAVDQRGFLRVVWGLFLPSHPLPKRHFDHLLPPALLDRLPDDLTHDAVATLRIDDALCACCFDHAVAMITRDWEHFSAHAAAAIVEAIEDHNLVGHFDPA